MRILEPIFPGAHQHELSRLVELRCSGNPVQPNQTAQVLIWNHSACLIAYLGPLRPGEKRLLSMDCAAGNNHPYGREEWKESNCVGRWHRKTVVLNSVEKKPFKLNSPGSDRVQLTDNDFANEW